jgi:hypothetical protein
MPQEERLYVFETKRDPPAFKQAEGGDDASFCTSSGLTGSKVSFPEVKLGED